MGGKDHGLDGINSLAELSSQLGVLAQTGHDDFQMGILASHTASLVQEVSVNVASEQADHLVANLRKLLASINDTIRRYAFSDSDQDTAAAAYLDFCLNSVTKAIQACQQFGLGQEIAFLLAEHGYDSTDLNGYHSHLCSLYAQAKREHQSTKPTGALSRRSITASYSAATFAQPRETARTSDNPPVITDLGGATRPPEQRKTELGIGGDQQGLKDLGNQNQPVIPTLVATGSLAALGQAFDDLAEETTTVNNPELDAAIAREQAAARQNEEPTLPGEEDEADRTDPNLDLSKLQAVMIFAKQNGHSLEAPKSKSDPVPLPETGVFTSAWVNGEGRKYGHSEVKRGNGTPSNGSNGKGFTGIASTLASTKAPKERDSSQPPLLSKKILPPSQYLSKNSPEKDAQTPTPRTPEAVKKSTRGRLYAWLAAAAVTLTGLGVGGKMLYDSQTRGNSSSTQAGETTSSPSAAPTSSESVDQKTPPPAPAEQKEASVSKEKGIFKVDTNHDAYKKYLNSIKSSSGLVAMIKDIAGQVKVDYFKDPAELQTARQKGIIALNGTETELEQRIAVMDAFLSHALKLNIENRWVVKFFTDAQKGLQTFKKTGTWDNQGRNSGADQLFEAFQAPKKLVAPPEVIGYAPDINPETNPALLKVKETAPTFYQVLLESGRRMQKETDPAKVVPFDEFNMIKAKTCEQILAVRSEYKDPDARSGIYYMHDAWCKNTANPYNYLNQALKRTVPIMAVKDVATPPPAPKQGQQPGTPIHNNIIQQNRFQMPLGEPVVTPLETPAVQPAKPATEKPGLLSRAVSKVKSFFGFGKDKKSEPQPEKSNPEPAFQNQPVSQVNPQTLPNEPIYTKKDIPMYSWKETLAQYFWG